MDARQTERAFIRRLKKNGGAFRTAKGRENNIVNINDETYTFSSSKEGSLNRFNRSKVRKAIQYVYTVRTVTRKEMEHFSSFSSALLGLMRMIFSDIAKYVETPTGLYRLTLKGIRYFFAGCERSVQEIFLRILKRLILKMLLMFIVVY
jgi:hypothetical protein